MMMMNNGASSEGLEKLGHATSDKVKSGNS